MTLIVACVSLEDLMTPTVLTPKSSQALLFKKVTLVLLQQVSQCAGTMQSALALNAQ